MSDSFVGYSIALVFIFIISIRAIRSKEYLWFVVILINILLGFVFFNTNLLSAVPFIANWIVYLLLVAGTVTVCGLRYVNQKSY